MSAVGRYRALLAVPGLRRVALLSLLGRLPLGMTPLGVLLLVRDGSGSYATAGLVAGVYAAASALVAPVRSRVVDRSGMTAVLVSSGVVHPLALLGLVAAVLLGAPPAVLLVLALLSGLAFPPVAAVSRALWTAIVPDGPLRRTAFSLESVLVEVGFVLGPLGVALAVLAGSPALAVVAAGLLVLAGSLGLAAAPVVRAWAPDRSSPRGRAGPLTSRPLRWLLAVALCLGGAIGAVEVAVPAFAERAGAPAAAGVLIAVWSLGSIAGGLWYGGRDHARPPSAHYPWLLAALAVGSALPLLATGLVSLGAVLALGGAAIAPVTACNAALVARFAPAGTVTEAFGWSTTAIFGGVSLGTAFGGLLVERVGTTAGLGLGAAAAVLGLLVGVARMRLFSEPAAAARG